MPLTPLISRLIPLVHERYTRAVWVADPFVIDELAAAGVVDLVVVAHLSAFGVLGDGRVWLKRWYGCLWLVVLVLVVFLVVWCGVVRFFSMRKM